MAAVVALVLAVGGTVLLLAYVQSAHANAGAAPATTDVLVATAGIPKGTPAGQVKPSTRVAAVPETLVAPGALPDAAALGELSGQVTTLDIQPGEQLLSSRFAKPADLAKAAGVTVPSGMEELTIPVAPERAVGGTLQAGQRVGVYISGTPDGKAPTTRLVLPRVLVVRVQGAPAPAPTPAPTAGPATAAPAPSATTTTPAPLPSGQLFVTLALPASDAERLVFGMEHASVWLSREDFSTPPPGTSVKTWQEINR